MHGDKLFATGIVIRQDWRGGWWAEATFEDFGHCDRGSVMGHIETKYADDDLPYTIDTIKRDVESLGVEFAQLDGVSPALLYSEDGEDEDFPPPDGWRELLKAEAQRIGFLCLYDQTLSEVRSELP